MKVKFFTIQPFGDEQVTSGICGVVLASVPQDCVKAGQRGGGGVPKVARNCIYGVGGGVPLRIAILKFLESAIPSGVSRAMLLDQGEDPIVSGLGHMPKLLVAHAAQCLDRIAERRRGYDQLPSAFWNAAG